MKKKYEYKSGCVYVTLPRTNDRKELIKATEDFLKRAIKGGYTHGNSNKSGNI